MIFDATTLFSDRQTVATTTVSTNVVDLGKTPKGFVRDIGKGVAIPILCQVVEDFGGTGSVRLSCDVSNDAAMPSASTEVAWESPAVSVSLLKAGYVFAPENVMRHTAKRYMRLRYTVTGSVSAGKITAGITMGNQSNG